MSDMGTTSGDYRSGTLDLLHVLSKEYCCTEIACDCEPIARFMESHPDLETASDIMLAWINEAPPEV
jgi:hypothetical protein